MKIRKLTLALRGEVFSGTAEEILSAINATSMMPMDNWQQYAARWNHYAGILGQPVLDNSSAEAFINGLITTGQAEELKND